jgi:hypothetical protein
MARINPFFEHAGMKRITESKPTAAVTEALQKLEQLGFESALLANTNYNEHKINKTICKTITAILTELSMHDAAVRRRLAGLRNIYPKHQEFTTKIATLNAHELAKTLKRLSCSAQTKVYLFWSKQQQNNMNQ